MLYERYKSKQDDYEELGVFVPEFIKENIKHELREYQQQALQNFIYWKTKDKKRLSENHILFQMATGTGKTLLMAFLILFLYKKGYRKFLFFVNSTNIIEKTKQNFVNSASSKYLFADNIQIDGKNISVRQINNFDEADEHNINIWFTTIHGLHSTLNNEKENAVTYEDFVNHKIVFLADEAHHNSTQTRQKQLELFSSWENTIQKSFNKNNENYLIELTATADLKLPEIAEKYQEKLIFNYDLRQFRKGGFSKNIRVVDTKTDIQKRILLALVISEYKKFVAGEYRLQIKPVVLFRSLTINESEKNAHILNQVITNLNSDDLTDLVASLRAEKDNSFLQDIMQFIQKHQDFLLQSIPIAFHQERVVNVNNEKANAANQLLLNTLENSDNQIRAIFAVNKLNEGWDVLNLYDIVKLYEVKNIKKTAISEVQLIGRGARYYPFLLPGNEHMLDTKYIRKYDNAIGEESRLKVLESLHYHSLQEVDFIKELNNQLEIEGLIDPVQKEVKISIKEDFKQTDVYKKGLVFSNLRQTIEPKFSELKLNQQTNLWGDDDYQIPSENIIIDLTKTIKEHSIEEQLQEEFKNYKALNINEISPHIFYKAIAKDDFFSFENISKYIKKEIKTVLDLQTVFAKSSITFHYKKGIEITTCDILTGLIQLLELIKTKMDVSQKRYKGTKNFTASNIHHVFKNLKKSVDKNIKDNTVIENTENINYFVQDSFYGDSSYEKDVITELNTFFNEDSNKTTYQDVYMIRNYGEIKLHNFDDGKGFEPDFILFLKKNNQDISYQLFVEPKGEHIAKHDEWKEAFLEKLCQISSPDTIKLVGFENKYKIVGLPFYDQHNTNKLTQTLTGKLNPSTQDLS